MADDNRKTIMSLRRITRDYPSGMEVVRVLKGVDLDIYENELLVILGESGSGKTTLLNIIGGMDRVTSGEITFDGRDFSNPSSRELIRFRRDAIGFIFQDYNLMEGHRNGGPFGACKELSVHAQRRPAAAGGHSQSTGKKTADHTCG